MGFRGALFRFVYKDKKTTETPKDYNTVHVLVTDDDMGSGGGVGPVLIKNIKPEVVITGVTADESIPESPDGETFPSRIEEGEHFKVFGQISDVGIFDTHDGVIKADSNGDGDMDDPGEASPITVTATNTPGLWTFEGNSPVILDDGPSGPWESNHTKSDGVPFVVEVYDDDMLRM